MLYIFIVYVYIFILFHILFHIFSHGLIYIRDMVCIYFEVVIYRTVWKYIFVMVLAEVRVNDEKAKLSNMEIFKSISLHHLRMGSFLFSDLDQKKRYLRVAVSIIPTKQKHS
jgi:hypothetical protein